jgi:uncharacterized protein
MFESAPRLISGLLIGIAFGFLLQKGRVAKFHVIVRQFTFDNWTVAKIMGTAIIVGAVGIYAMLPAGLVSLDVKPLLLGGILLGALCFGIGLVVFGYCPGTGVAACGEGRRDAMVGVLGGLAGAGAYVVAYPLLKGAQNWGDYGKLTLPDATGLSAWLWIAAFAGLAGLVIAIRAATRGRTTRGAVPQAGPTLPSLRQSSFTRRRLTR